MAEQGLSKDSEFSANSSEIASQAVFTSGRTKKQAFESDAVFSFVWRLQDLHEKALQIHRDTGTRIIADPSQLGLEDAVNCLHSYPFSGFKVDLKIPFPWLLEPGIEPLVEDPGIETLWVEYHPLVHEQPMESFLNRVSEISRIRPCCPVLGDTQCIQELLREPSLAIRGFAIKGLEASGFVSTESVLVLYGAVRELVRENARQTDITIWGGIATPEACSAFLTCGAKGVVFECLHWLTDLHPLSEMGRRSLEKLRYHQTDIAGLNLGIPYRAHNRGNAVPLKALKDLSSGGHTAETRRRQFISMIAGKAVHPLDGNYTREELIPLGVEAAFARDFAERFGVRTGEAIRGLVAETARLHRKATENPRPFAASATAREMGTRYPFIQGGMSSISDVPEFALEVARAGGLPTIALGFMDKEAIVKRLGDLDRLMGGQAYALNMVSLQENPFRNEQMEWIREHRPPFVVIAAGEPSIAREMAKEGIETIYIAPTEELLQMALEAGIRYIVLEGCEAGGHVGHHTTLTLAQMALLMRRCHPTLWQEKRVILAGGICNGDTAFMAWMLGADAIQMGTAYLATREIVETGALTRVYQSAIMEASLGDTIITGESTGLRVRSLKTPKTNAICALEEEFLKEGTGILEHRRKMEELCAGSLYIAARGEDKCAPGILDDRTCLERGQFMSGACAGTIRGVCTIAQLHHELAEGARITARPELLRETGKPAPPFRKSVSWQGFPERIAITGMSMVNALGNSLQEIFEASLAGKSGITTVPPSRWGHEAYYSPVPMTPEKTYCRVGAFHHVDITRKELGVPPQDFRTMTDSTRMTLWLASQAIEQSGILESGIPKERIGVIISQNSGEAASTFSDIVIGGAVEPTVATVRRLLPMSPDQEKSLRDMLKNGHLVVDDTTLVGRLNCTAGGYISNKYGFMGPSFAVTAACSSSLVALYNAILMIRLGIIDAAVVGGGEEPLHPLHYLEFSALGALAGISGKERLPEHSSRPFDLGRDGMVLGEGGAIIVIERESLARKRDVDIHGLITGVGASNNPYSLIESSRESQEIAIRASLAGLPYGPSEIDLIECHATSTAQGDVEEVHAIRRIFSRNQKALLTSFKSQIGHTLGSSGLNSLIRGVMAMKAGVIPPTINYETPDPNLGLEEAGLRVATEPETWRIVNGRPRRMQVNSFGFGGSNFVVQIEECRDERGRPPARMEISGSSGMEPRSPESLQLEGISLFRVDHGNRSYRTAILNGSQQELDEALQLLRNTFEEVELSDKTLRSLARRGIHVEPIIDAAPPVALLFPGQGSQYTGMGRELYYSFPVVRTWLEKAAAVADFDLLSLYLEDREEQLRQTLWQQPAAYALEYALYQQLLAFGIQPAAMAGHSLGELTALAAAGAFSFEDGFRLVTKRARSMDKASALRSDPGVMMATDAPLALLQQQVALSDQVFIANINSPLQVVLGGSRDAVHKCGERIKEFGYRATLLRVSMAFHCPLLPIFSDEMRAFTKALPFRAPRVPVISNTIRKPFPEDPDAIKEIVVAHPESPVYWMDNVLTLWNDYGIRRFVEIGPGATLSDLVRETVENAICIPTCMPGAEGASLKQAVAKLFVKGHICPAGPVDVVSIGEKATNNPTHPPIVHVAQGTVPHREERLASLVQREINAFVVDMFGRFVTPMILEAIRREIDPAFSEAQLQDLLQSMYQRSTQPFSVPAAQVSSYIGQPGAHAPAASTEQPLLVTTDAPSSLETTIASVPAPQEPGDIIEKVVAMIMEVTGYERDEIEPQMDLRLDLGIRSSRLPIIVDHLERRFSLRIRMEEFLDVRTVSEMAERIAQLTQGSLSAAPAEEPSSSDLPLKSKTARDTRAEDDLKRLVFKHLPVTGDNDNPHFLTPESTVALLAPLLESGFAAELARLMQDHYKLKVRTVPFLDGQGEKSRKDSAFFFKDDPQARLDPYLDNSPTDFFLIVIDKDVDSRLRSAEDVCRLQERLFLMLKSILAFPSGKSILLIQDNKTPSTWRSVLADGVVGMFLSAAMEYPSRQFRSVKVEDAAHLCDLLPQLLDNRQPLLDLTLSRDGLTTRVWHRDPVVLRDLPNFTINAGDVILVSGGGYGITTQLARALSPFAPRIILLGRTPIDLPEALARHLEKEEFPEKALRWEIIQINPKITLDDLNAQIDRLRKTVKIHKTLKEFRRAEMDVEYISCDVADERQVKAAVDRVVVRYGRVDGIIHGAGVLQDKYISDMDTKTFKKAVEVKLLGAWNLYRAARGAGLKFFVALSSIVAIQGNMGQTNYGAGNRMMSRLLAELAEENPAVLFKALMLPPVSGGGMAENREIRDILERFGVGYIGLNDLSEMFCREIFFGAPGDVWVMWMKSLPPAKTVLLEGVNMEEMKESFSIGLSSFSPQDYPMIDAIERLDLEEGLLQARRTFSHEKDNWLADHKPFKFLKNPLVSAIMAIESFVEASQLLIPYLTIREVRNIQFTNTIDVGPEMERQTRITCQQRHRGKEVHCECTLGAYDVNRKGRRLESLELCYSAELIASRGPREQPAEFEGFPIPMDELNGRPMQKNEIIRWYEQRSDIRGLYRVLEHIDGYGSSVISGSMMYPAGAEFSFSEDSGGHYPRYALEGLMQLCSFYVIMRDESETRAMIPAKVKTLRWFAPCDGGDVIRLEARLIQEDDHGLVWDSLASHRSGRPVLEARGIRMRWFGV